MNLPSPVAPPRRAFALYALGLLTAINLLNYFERNVIFALFEPLKGELHLGDLHLGWLASAYVLVFSLASLPLGVLSDLRSRPGVIAVGVGLWSVGTSLGGLATGFVPLLVCRSLVGLGGAAAGAASASLIADYFPGPRRALAMGVFMAGIPLGGVLGILAAGQLGAAYGWRVAFLALGLPGFIIGALAARLADPARPGPPLSLIQALRDIEGGAGTLVRATRWLLTGTAVGGLAALLLDRRLGAGSSADVAAFAALAGIGLALDIWRWVRGAPAHRAGGAVLETALAELLAAGHAVLATPTLVYVFLGGALISFGMNGLIGWAPSFMSREMNISVADVTLALGKWGLVAGIAGTLAGGLIADALRPRWPAARAIVSGVGFIIGGPLAFWLLTIRDFSLFVPVFSAAFFFLTWYNGPLNAVIFDVTPARISSTVAGAYLFFIHIAGDAVAFPLVGALSDRLGIDRAVLLLPVMSLLGGILSLGAVRTIVRDTARATAAGRVGL